MSDTDFLAYSRHHPRNYLVLRILKALSSIYQLDRVARKASGVSAAYWRYQTRVKEYRIFTRVLLRLFSGLEIVV